MERRRIKVQHTGSGLDYILCETEEGVYLTSPDGMVHIGQMLYGETIETVLSQYPLKRMENNA